MRLKALRPKVLVFREKLSLNQVEYVLLLAFCLSDGTNPPQPYFLLTRHNVSSPFPVTCFSGLSVGGGEGGFRVGEINEIPRIVLCCDDDSDTSIGDIDEAFIASKSVSERKFW